MNAPASSTSNEISAAYFIPVARGDLNRVLRTVQSIRKHCRHYKLYLLLDGIHATELPPGLPGDDLVVKERHPSTGKHWGEIWRMQCRAMVEALSEPELSKTAVFVKMDADAIVIRSGLAQRAQGIFASRPRAGQLGQCFTNVLGDRLQNPGWASYYRNMLGWRGLARFARATNFRLSALPSAFRVHQDFRSILLRAHANGYVFGEFAIGGCYVLRREVVEYLATPNLLERSPFRLLPDTGEDGVMTPYVYAAGYAAMDDVSDGGLFAIEGKELRVDPFTLKARGHYVIHPVKFGHHAHGHHLTEEDLVSALI
jgi:hypothetical protein